jgi:hypothetical protein
LILAQLPIPEGWAEVLNHSVAIGVIMFIGFVAVWWLKRTYGVDGTATKESEARIECGLANAKTMAANQITLIELKDLSAKQQQLCGQHASALITVGTELDGLEGKVGRTVIASEKMCDMWAGRNHREYKTSYLVDLAMEAIDTLGQVANKCDLDCAAELQSLRTKAADAKNHMQRGEA